MLKQLKTTHYLIAGLALVIIVMLLFWPQKDTKHDTERERLNEIIETQAKTVKDLQKDTTFLYPENRRLEALLVSRQSEVSKLRESLTHVKETAKKARSFTNEQHDSTFLKLFPIPDSILFAKGSKAEYVIHVQKQVYENLIELDYATKMVMAMDSTIAVFDKLVFQKDLIIGNQKETIVALTDLNETLLQSQVNDLGEISKLKRKKRFAGFIIKVGIPAALIGGIYLGSKL